MINDLAVQLNAAGVGVFPCNAEKKPATPRGVNWQTAATQHPSATNWPTGIIGLPVPQGVVIIDLDTYKGVTREQVEQALGCTLPWDSALIQTTQRGGQHYAFSVDWLVKQGTNVEKIRGLDTRVAGKGYICTGEGYTPHGFGPFALSQPAALPRLPDALRPRLENVAPTTSTTPTQLPEGDRDADTIIEALRHVDPGCSRSEWLRVGLALRHHFHDDAETGLAIFDSWSSGRLSASGEPPANYVPETMAHQWGSFKAEGGTTIASLFYTAIAEGWKPPRGLDTAAAFGGTTVSVDQFDALIDRITESGGDPKSTGDLVTAIYGTGCNELQRGMLLAALHRELKEAGLLTKEVRKLLEGKKPVKPQGEYGKNHTENAAIFADTHYPNGSLVRSQEVWYCYDGKSWVARSNDEVKHEVATAMAHCLPQHSTVAGTYNMLESLAGIPGMKIGETPEGLVLCQNGALDLTTGRLLPHSKDYFTTNILPYDYNIQARCDHWKQFLNDIFEGDAERIALLQEWFGYLLANNYDFQKVMVLLGPKRCGKGTIGRVLKLLVGPENYTGGTLNSFAKDSFIESLQTKTVMFIGDAAKQIPRALLHSVTERIKGISGCDDQTFDRKYKSTLSEQLPTRITIAANHVPQLFDDSGALAGRLLVLPFNVSWYNREDPALYARLAQDIEGVAMWALRGLARLKENGRFTEPAESLAETEYISEAYSPLRMFIDQAVRIDCSENTHTAQEVYDTYRAWAVMAQEDTILPRRAFTSSFKDVTRGTGIKYGTYRTDGTTPQRGFKGLHLKPIGKDQGGSIPLHAVK